VANFTSYDAVGIKEDVSDIISNISPTKTPFQSDIGNEKVTQRLFDWQEDSLRAVAPNAQIEGADASFVTVVPTVLRANNTQILMEAVQVTGSMDATSSYGRAKESAYQLAKSAAQCKRDLENAYVGTKQTAVTGATGTARQMAGAQAQIAASHITYMGLAATLDEAHLLTALQNAYTDGAEPNVVYVTPSNSLSVAAFAKAAGRFRSIVDSAAAPGKVVNTVDIYVSPFGEVRVKINRFQAAGDTLVVDTTQWAKVTFRPWTRETLAKTGDSTKQMIVGEFSLKHKNQKASALVVDNATSGL
jgi:hypothetical protein